LREARVDLLLGDAERGARGNDRGRVVRNEAEIEDRVE
jgi:hypothetical protein